MEDDISLYFEKQIKTARTLSPEDMLKIKGTGLYGKYVVGDLILFFMEEYIQNSNMIKVEVKSTTYDELTRLNLDYEFCRIGSKDIPILRKKEV